MKTYRGKLTHNPQKEYHKHFAHQRYLVIQKYGGVCVGCGSTELATLSIDHKTDPTTLEKAKKTEYGGSHFYRRLLKEPLRDDLQVLCMSCQFKKRTYGPNITNWPAKRQEFEAFAAVPCARRKQRQRWDCGLIRGNKWLEATCAYDNDVTNHSSKTKEEPVFVLKHKTRATRVLW